MFKKIIIFLSLVATTLSQGAELSAEVKRTVASQEESKLAHAHQADTSTEVSLPEKDLAILLTMAGSTIKGMGEKEYYVTAGLSKLIKEYLATKGECYYPRTRMTDIAFSKGGNLFGLGNDSTEYYSPNDIVNCITGQKIGTAEHNQDLLSTDRDRLVVHNYNTIYHLDTETGKGRLLTENLRLPSMHSYDPQTSGDFILFSLRITGHTLTRELRSMRSTKVTLYNAITKTSRELEFNGTGLRYSLLSHKGQPLVGAMTGNAIYLDDGSPTRKVFNVSRRGQILKLFAGKNDDLYAAVVDGKNADFYHLKQPTPRYLACLPEEIDCIEIVGSTIALLCNNGDVFTCSMENLEKNVADNISELFYEADKTLFKKCALNQVRKIVTDGTHVACLIKPSKILLTDESLSDEDPMYAELINNQKNEKQLLKEESC